MGFYIQTPEGHFNKAENIAKRWGGKVVPDPPSFESLESSGQVLVAVGNQRLFEAAGICYDRAEHGEFTSLSVPMTYVVLSKDAALEAFTAGLKAWDQAEFLTAGGDRSVAALRKHLSLTEPSSQT